MKDLTILPDHLRDIAFVSGGECGWPLDKASEVIRALVDAGAVVSGVEAWSVDAEGVPASVGWSFYELEDCADDWQALAAASRVEAERVLASVMETAAEHEVNYVGIEWDTCGDAEAAEA